MTKIIKRRIRRKTYTLWQTLKRVLQYRLIIPMKRSNKPPEFTARATFVGVFLAMNPMVGVQMYLCFLVWLFSKHLLKKDFSLPIACAWTWITNVFTMIPTDYVFFVTGKYILGERELYSYSYFFDTFKESFKDNMTLLENVKVMIDIFVKDWGVAMFVGAVPWMIVSSLLGYFISYRYALRRYMKKQIILAKALEKAYQKEFEEQKRREQEAKESEFVR
ncbi:MAG: hypothetical protein BWY78_01477 [Alphaproteobacteria bacterium ADurb.Bin438]|nr:MAG: hypothetical protein BWY78_01477 [Alphaproteobacteria bacterium ADurb.Bin438]